MHKLNSFSPSKVFTPPHTDKGRLVKRARRCVTLRTAQARRELGWGLQRVINTAQKIAGCSLASLADVASSRYQSRAINMIMIMTSSKTPLTLVTTCLSPPGGNTRHTKGQTNRLRDSFSPRAISTMRNINITYCQHCYTLSIALFTVHILSTCTIKLLHPVYSHYSPSFYICIAILKYYKQIFVNYCNYYFKDIIFKEQLLKFRCVQ